MSNVLHIQIGSEVNHPYLTDSTSEVFQFVSGYSSYAIPVSSLEEICKVVYDLFDLNVPMNARWDKCKADTYKEGFGHARLYHGNSRTFLFTDGLEEFQQFMMFSLSGDAEITDFIFPPLDI